MIKAILACDEDWGIGKDGDLPWPHNPADLQWFKKMTYGQTIVMGRATWDSLPIKPLPGRVNVIVTTQDINGALGNIVVDMEGLLKILPQLKVQNKDIWIIGGAQLVESCFDIIDELWLSRIEGIYDCDVKLSGTKILEQFELDSVSPQTDIYVEKWIKK